MRVRAFWGAASVSLVVWATSCGDSGNGGASQVCVPGQQETCGCPGGTIGAQACEPDGSGFEPCICDAGTGEASSNASTTTTTSDTTGDGSTHGGSSSDGGSTSESGSTGMPDDAPACYDEDAALDGGWTQVVTGQGVCTPEQIDTHFDVCLDPTPDMMSCDAFEMDASSQPCFECMYGLNTATIGPLFSVPMGDMVSTYPNRIGCEAAAQGLPECAPVVSELLYCAFTACSACAMAETQACRSYALDDPDSICNQLFVIPESCEALLMPTQASPECAGETFGAYYDNAVPFFCGPP